MVQTFGEGWQLKGNILGAFHSRLRGIMPFFQGVNMLCAMCNELLRVVSWHMTGATCEEASCLVSTWSLLHCRNIHGVLDGPS